MYFLTIATTTCDTFLFPHHLKDIKFNCNGAAQHVNARHKGAKMEMRMKCNMCDDGEEIFMISVFRAWCDSKQNPEILGIFLIGSVRL